MPVGFKFEINMAQAEFRRLLVQTNERDALSPGWHRIHARVKETDLRSQ